MTALIKSHPQLPLATLALNCIPVTMATDSKMERQASDREGMFQDDNHTQTTV